MKILISPDSFKDSISSTEFSERAEKVINSMWPEAETVKCPLADGGEGSLTVIMDTIKGHWIDLEVTGPLGERFNTKYGMTKDRKTALIEMARASGLELVPIDQRNPMRTTTFGLGEMIHDALKKNCEKIVVFIGGSATNDGGLGMLQALGFQCLNHSGNEIDFGGKGMCELSRIIPPKVKYDFKKVDIMVACDVDNPLYGRNGAAYVYAEQKGANKEMIKLLDEGLISLSEILKRDLNRDVNTLKGGGAAGGVGAALYAGLGAQICSGFEVFRVLLKLDALLDQGFDLVITGEGQINKQSIYGKLPIQIARLANERGIKTIVLVGAKHMSLSEVKQEGVIGIYPVIQAPMLLDQAIKETAESLEECIFNVLSTIKYFA